MALLISGIGRSGTTTLYQILGKGLLSKYGNARCVYEPYLWNIPEVECTAKVKGQPFNVGQLGLFNAYAHCNTPLFLSGRYELHDAWLNRVFRPINPGTSAAPNNVMAKIIRGSGRLEAALTMFNNLKVVLVTRNVVDTVNSGLGLFSFFGDEFHPSDKGRFVQEVNHIFNAEIDISTIENELQWSVLWWHYFTEASLRTCVNFPNRVMLVPYEKYLNNKLEVMKTIFEFAGIENSFIDHNLFEVGAGPQTKVSYLTTQNIEQMNDELVWYFKELIEISNFSINAFDFRRKLISKYTNRRFVNSLCLSEKTDLTAVQWRNKLLQKQMEYEVLANKHNNIEKCNKKTYTGMRAMTEFGDNSDALMRCRMEKHAHSKTKRVSRSIGVLITCYNNQNTIAEAIYSVLSQSRKPDLVVIADDCSTDGSMIEINKIVARHKNIKVIQRSENVGVAANRDLAIRAMETDYITTLDGDDLFFPEKIELESNALGGAIDKVAFSNIAVLGAKDHFIQDTTPYTYKNKEEMLYMLTSRSAPVPRDMMFSKALFEKAEGFDVGLDIYEDWSFKMRLINISKNLGWVHSGGKGTLYNRRNPGLSGEKPINHAYGQLLALSRNSDMLQNYPKALIAGLKNCSNHLNGNIKDRFINFINQIDSSNSIENLVSRLSAFWAEGTFKNDTEYKYQHIRRLTSIKGKGATFSLGKL